MTLHFFFCINGILFKLIQKFFSEIPSCEILSFNE